MHFRLSVLIAVLALAAASSAAPKKGNAAVITVDGKAIQRSQIDTLAALMARSQKVEDPARRKLLEKMVATNLIGQELLDKEAKTLRIEAKPAEVDSALKAFRSNFPDAASFQKALREAGDTEAKLKEKIARQIRADKTLATLVHKPEPPSETEMKAFWEKNKKEFPVNDSLRALQILLRADAKVKGEAANAIQRKLEEARKEVEADTSTAMRVRLFMTLAAKLSEGPEGKAGGDLQRFHPNDFNPEFKKQVRALKVGQLSPVFRTPVGYHLVLLIEKYDGKYESYKLQILQNLVAQKTVETGAALRKQLKTLAGKYPVKYLDPSYRDSSEAGIYN